MLIFNKKKTVLTIDQKCLSFRISITCKHFDGNLKDFCL